MNLEFIHSLNLFDEELLGLEKLENQGFNNINYLLKTSKKSYIVRVFKSNDSVNISRKFEYEIQKKAYKKNIASKPIFLNDDLIIYEYVKGTHKTKLRNKDIKKLISKVKKYHKFKIKENPYNLKSDLLNYAKILKDDKSKKIIKESLKILNKIRKNKKDFVLTHHDLNPKNILFQKNNIKIIDWEYAGINNRFFDLASICIEFKLKKKKEQLLLEHYFKKNHKYSNQKELNNFKNIYSNLCYLWFEKANKL